jgi:hypothetical protein
MVNIFEKNEAVGTTPRDSRRCEAVIPNHFLPWKFPLGFRENGDFDRMLMYIRGHGCKCDETDIKTALVECTVMLNFGAPRAMTACKPYRGMRAAVRLLTYSEICELTVSAIGFSSEFPKIRTRAR